MKSRYHKQSINVRGCVSFNDYLPQHYISWRTVKYLLSPPCNLVVIGG
jgi:hypothetical protein